MNKITKLTNRQLVYGALTVLVICSYVAIGMMWQHQRAEVNALNSQLQTVTENQFAMNAGSYNAVTIIPSENAVYLPLVKLKLSATLSNLGLVYSYSPDHTIPGNKKVFPAQLDISTHDLAVSSFSTTKQFDCSQVVYADFITPSYPVNPMWKSNGSIKLADARVMNIYYAPDVPGCNQTWQMNNIDAKALADSLKQAVSY